MDELIAAFNDYLDSPLFYEIMQDYRHAPVEDQARVIIAFAAVQNALLLQVSVLMEDAQLAFNS